VPAAQSNSSATRRGTRTAEESWAHSSASSVRADSDEGRLPVIALEYKILRHSPELPRPAEADDTRTRLVGAQPREPCQGGQRRGETAGDLIVIQVPAAQPQPVRSPPGYTAHADGLVGAQPGEPLQGRQRRVEAAGDLIVTQAPAAQPQPVCNPPRHTAHAEGSWAHR
jgi:hypothetical protein